MNTTADTAEWLRLKVEIRNLSHADQLRAAATLLDEGKQNVAEAIAGHVVDELRATRMWEGKR